MPFIIPPTQLYGRLPKAAFRFETEKADVQKQIIINLI